MTHRKELDELGFTVIPGIFEDGEMDSVLSAIQSANTSNASFRKSEDLFAVRQFFREIPQVQELVFTEAFKAAIANLIGDGFFVVKSIYFDKPEKSNWFVSYHQDLTISVDKKAEVPGYGPWTVKQDRYAVQPPLNILHSIYTVRIHLDHTNENNGALKVVPGSHQKGIYRPETIDWTKEKETTCTVPKGGMMIMRPLLLHSSGRSTTNQQRRVIHIEFSNVDLVPGLNWAEKTTHISSK